MKLTTSAEVDEFLNDFKSVIMQTAAAGGHVLNSFTNEQQRTIFVDQRYSRELLFLIQFYNRIAQIHLTNEIDVKMMLDDMLKENGLCGVNVDEISTDLLMFFSKYRLVDPVERVFKQPARLQASIAELTQEMMKLGNGNCYQNSVNSLIQLTRPEDPTADKSDNAANLISHDNYNKMITSTRKLIAPKFGEKNCFSYEARHHDYKKKATLTGAACVANGLLGAISELAAVAFFLGTLIGYAALYWVLPHSVTACALTCIGELAFAPVASVVTTGLVAIGASLIVKADHQRKMSSTMFSIANASDRSATDAKAREDGIIYNEKSPSYSC